RARDHRAIPRSGRQRPRSLSAARLRGEAEGARLIAYTLPMVRGKKKRGRPAKFGRPARVVALTLPEDVVRGLRRVNPDLAWAVVSVFEKGRGGPAQIPDAELVNVGNGRSLITVNHAALKTLPGVHLIPMNGQRALLSLEPGRGVTDLELAV